MGQTLLDQINLRHRQPGLQLPDTSPDRHTFDAFALDPCQSEMALKRDVRTWRAHALERVLVEEFGQQVAAAALGGGRQRLRQQVHQREIHDAAHLSFTSECAH